MFAALEDNQVQLSTMKASRFVKAFEHDVDQWERTLSLILEVTEMLLTVQRQWMYLEVKFSLLQKLSRCNLSFVCTYTYLDAYMCVCVCIICRMHM